MMATQVGCQVATSRGVQRPPYYRAFLLDAEETPLVSQRLLSLPDSEVEVNREAVSLGRVGQPTR